MSLDVYLYGAHTCESCGHISSSGNAIFNANITHNLGAMAQEAGVYMHLWRPEEIDITRANQLIEPLTNAVALMKADSPRFEQHDAPNRFGVYRDFVPWIEAYLAACIEHPDAFVRASR